MEEVKLEKWDKLEKESAESFTPSLSVSSAKWDLQIFTPA